MACRDGDAGPKDWQTQKNSLMHPFQIIFDDGHLRPRTNPWGWPSPWQPRRLPPNHLPPRRPLRRPVPQLRLEGVSLTSLR